MVLTAKGINQVVAECRNRDMNAVSAFVDTHYSLIYVCIYTHQCPSLWFSPFVRARMVNIMQSCIHYNKKANEIAKELKRRELEETRNHYDSQIRAYEREISSRG